MWFMGPFYSNPGSQTARGFRRQPLYQEPPFSPRKGRLFARGLRPVPPLPFPPSRSFPNRAEKNWHTWTDRRWAGHTARLRRGGPVMRRRRDSVHAHAVEVPACHPPFEREKPQENLADRDMADGALPGTGRHQHIRHLERQEGLGIPPGIRFFANAHSDAHV